MDKRTVALAAIACVAFACKKSTPEPEPQLPPLPAPDITPAEAAMSRLTATQYRNALRDLLGPDVVLPVALEPDIPAGGFIAVGASRTTISPWGVEQYENAAYDLAEQVMDSAELRAVHVPCTPRGSADDVCAEMFVRQFGRRLWRRPLVDEEVTALVGIARTSAETLGDFYDGLEFAMAAMLQSPNFLFRAELGRSNAYDDYEIAARLAFFLWNTTPDDALLDAAAASELTNDATLAIHVQRLIDSPRSRVGVRNFFTELLELYELEELSKDPTVFVHFSSEVGHSAMEETLRGFESLIFEQDGDYRDAFTTRRTFVDRRLAAIYNVRASKPDGFGEVMLDADGPRRGLLGQVSFLALQSHATASSATLRGHFVRVNLLCHTVPPPPVNVNTALPEPSGTARTLRDRVGEHLSSPACAGCHSLMDPIGLGLEHFDGLGRFRTMDNDALINPAGDLDGIPFTNASDLAQILHDHPDVPACLVRGLYRYATGNIEDVGEKDTVEWLAGQFARSGYKVKAVLFEIAMSKGFRQVREASR